MAKKNEETLKEEKGIERPQTSFIDKIGQSSKGLDAMAEKLTDVLFSKDKLLMTARLTREYALMIIRNSIVSRFFIGYYGQCVCEITLEKISVPPFYKKKIFEDAPNKYKAFQGIMADLNDELLQITISQDGLGRIELKDIVTAVVGKSAEDSKRLGIL